MEAEVQDGQAVVESYHKYMQDLDGLYRANLQPKELEQIMQQINAKQSQVKNAQQFHMDMKCMVRASHIGTKIAKGLNNDGQNYSIEDILRSITQVYNDSSRSNEQDVQIDWFKLGDMVKKKNIPPSIPFQPLIGRVDTFKLKCLAQRTVTRRRDYRGEAEQAEKVDIAERGEGSGEVNETEKVMTEMWGRIQSIGEHGVDMISLVLNHNSMAQTVENVFALSFLVFNHKVQLSHTPETNPNGVQVIPTTTRLSEQYNRNNQANGASSMRQFDLSFSHKHWEVWKLAVPESECIMPDRGYGDVDVGLDTAGGGVCDEFNGDFDFEEGLLVPGEGQDNGVLGGGGVGNEEMIEDSDHE